MKNFRISRLGFEEFYYTRKKQNRLYWMIPLLLILILVFLFKEFEEYLRIVYSETSYTEANIGTWISSIASFWGAILGGVIAGVTSIAGIVLTIKYYRESDQKNRILENKPFINIQSINSFEGRIPYEIKKLCTLGSGNNSIAIEIAIENLGRNFLRTLTYNDGSNQGGFAFNHVIKSGQKFETTFSVEIKYDHSCEKMLYFTFMDCFMNEYMQGVVFKVDSKSERVKDKVQIEANYPVLIETVFK